MYVSALEKITPTYNSIITGWSAKYSLTPSQSTGGRMHQAGRSDLETVLVPMQRQRRLHKSGLGGRTETLLLTLPRQGIEPKVFGYEFRRTNH